jgi:ATPase subunit of ABC transporter with duplicated ATPase domains
MVVNSVPESRERQAAPPGERTDSRHTIEARGLAKTYGKVTALERFDVSARAGEVVGLLGPNVAGKTTIRLLTINWGGAAPRARGACTARPDDTWLASAEESVIRSVLAGDDNWCAARAGLVRLARSEVWSRSSRSRPGGLMAESMIGRWGTWA